MGCVCAKEKYENELDDNRMQEICKFSSLLIIFNKFSKYFP
jgi:hypothetical protein